MVQVQKLTAEALLGAPRRGVAVPDHAGKLALHSVSTHTFGDKTLHEVRVMDLATRASTRLSDDAKVHDAVWMPGSSDVMFLRSADAGRTQLLVANAADASRARYVVAELHGPVANLKVVRRGGGSGGAAFVVTGLVGHDGRLFNGELEHRKTTARVFDTAHIRVWDQLFQPRRYSLWYSTLARYEGKWKLTGQLRNLVSDATLDAPFLYDLADPLDNFDVSPKGVTFLARDLTKKRPEEATVVLPYFVPLESFSLPPASKPKAISLPAGIVPGNGANIRFSPDASSIAFLYTQPGDVYKSRLYVAATSSLEASDIFQVTGYPDDPPEAFAFAGASDSVILRSQRCGRSVLSSLKLRAGERPKPFFTGGTTAAVFPLEQDKWDNLVVSSSSFIDSSLWQVVSVSKASVVRTISSATKHGAKFGLSAGMVTEFWYKGADNISIHTFMLRPSDFDEKKKYPWVLMPHGGPIAAWTDSWSTRWNMAAWAEQGYVVVCPNITGSTGYGLEFVRAVNGEWGGRPFRDLLHLIAHLEKLPYLAYDKAVLVGASYGAYMISWMMGHDVINKFCCAVWHDGIYNLPSFALQTDVLYDEGSYKGVLYPWQDPAAFEKHNPGRPELVRRWRHAPPTLLIHSEKDYRCPMTEGIAAANVLHAQGVPTRFLTFSDEGHWVLGPENARVWHETVWDWVRRCVHGKVKRGDTTW